MRFFNQILSIQTSTKPHTLIQGIEQAVEWLAVNRQQAPRLNMEGDRLHIKLLRQHNKASALDNAAKQNCSIGLFGLAQAGKSYLINLLAASEKGQLACALGNNVVRYQQLNPQQQTASLVVRFSARQQSSDSNLPVRLALLSECEIVAILAQQYRQQHSDSVTYFDGQQLNERLQNVAMYRQAEMIPGITPYQMVALWDNINALQHVPNTALDNHFWPQAVDLAPSLGVDDRARLFSLLWEDNHQLTALYRQLAHVLHHLSCVSQVLAPLCVLDEPAYSLLNHSGVSQFNASTDLTVQVAPQYQGCALPVVSMALAELTLLSREVLLPFYSAPREPLFGEVDLIDYPGIIANQELPDDEQQALAMGFLLARRPFLLQRAAVQQEVTHLLVCCASGSRQQTCQVGRLLNFWIKQTQGVIHSGRKPGLIWAMTPFDLRITCGYNHDAAVQRYVGTPGDAWGAMLAMDEKDVQRMTDYLVNEVRHESKLERINTLRSEVQRELHDNLLGRWYQSADTEDPAERLRIATILLKALQTRTGVHGELLERLVPTRDILRQLFLQCQHRSKRTTMDEYNINADDPFGIGMIIDLLSDEPLTKVQTSYHCLPIVDQEAEFARKVYHYWVNQLRQLPDNGPLLELLNVTKPTLEILAEELITASVRQEIDSQLLRILADSDVQGLPAGQITDRQVARALSVLGDFVAWLGFQQLPEAQRPESRINRGQKIFAKPEAQSANLGPDQRLVQLALKPNNHTAFYIYDWLVGLNETIVQNAGYTASHEIPQEQREQLGQILTVIRHLS